MTDEERLERAYRRLLAFYPRAFRRDNEQEVLAVLMACAQDGLRRPGFAVSADLLKSAALMRVRPRTGPLPRNVRAAVKLMCVGAAMALAAVISTIVTTGAVRAAIVARYPGLTAAQWHAIAAGLTVQEALGPLVVVLWLWLAWAISRGHDYARLMFIALFILISVSMLIALGQDAAIVATADFIVGSLEWLASAVAMVLIFTKAANPYYRREPDAVATR